MITIHRISTLQDVRDFLHEYQQELNSKNISVKDIDEVPAKSLTQSQYDNRIQLIAQCWIVCDKYQIDLNEIFKKIVDKYSSM
jgi:hypothetical protein